MSIKCYLYSSRARQINHTYYSLENNRGLEFYYNLSDFYYNLKYFYQTPFIYEIEIKAENIIDFDSLRLKATEFKIIKEIDFKTIAIMFSPSARTKNELASIFDGSAEAEKVITLYKKLVQKPFWQLSKVEQLKLFTILSQNCYDLPIINISNYETIRYTRFLKFYNKPYKTDLETKNHYHFLLFKKEELYGSKEFETGVELPMKELICHINLKQYIETRKLSQEQFEEYCEYMFHEERTIYYTSHAIATGYKILPKYKKHFYPYLIYSDPEMALELLNKRNLTRTEVIYFYEKNYKIGDYNYSNDKVRKTKATFVKDDDYKYIEVATQ